MANMPLQVSRRMPPLNPLRAFEVAARHLSFTNAADELCVTQGAVSRSVKALEDFLGQSLFERTGHGLALTEQSEAMALKLSDAFQRLGEAADEFRGIQASPVLTVRAYTSFMIGFLIPKLPDFQIQHPEIKVRLVSASDLAELSSDHSDVRIRLGRGQWKNCESTLLFKDCVRPLCSPMLLDPAKAPYPLEVLRDHVLLHQERRREDWPAWLAMVGADHICARDNRMFYELSVVYQAGLAGVGMVMAQKAYFRQELSNGLLFEPFEHSLARDIGYYLSVPNNRRDAPHVRLFKRWLLQQMEKAGLGENGPVSGIFRAPRPADRSPAWVAPALQACAR